MVEIKGKILEKPPESFWIASTKKDNYPALEDNINVDAVIIGGGMTGISTAYMLKKEGLKVAVIEADRICQGTSGHTTAKITSQHDLIYDEILTKMGKEWVSIYADANETAIRTIKDIIHENRLECDYEEQQAFVITMQDSYIEKLENETKSANEAGIKAEYLDSVPLPFKIKAAMRFDKQAQFHSRKYVLGLAKKIQGDGSYIFESTRALDIEEKDGFLKVLTDGKGTAAGRFVIIASHYPFYDGEGLYFTRIYPYRSYILGVKVKDKYPGGMYITAEDPGRSLRTVPAGDGELLLVGGEHHRTGQGEDMVNHYLTLEKFARENYTVEDIPYRWSAQDYTSMDKVPYIGYINSKTKNIFVATGFRKWGMTTSTVAAIITRDLILKGENPWVELFRPSRFTTFSSAGKFAAENANVAAQLISGKLSGAPNDVEIKNGEGKIVEIDGEKVGAYRDEKGKLHLVKSTCTHLGCQLAWNSAELTWDCPCHGSRFTYEGEIAECPALKTIKREPENRE